MEIDEGRQGPETERMAPPKPTLSQQVRDGLVELIVSGRLKSGERLVETRIAADFGTSQAPVREALSELESLG